MVDGYIIIQAYMKLISILFESLDLKRIRRKSLFVKRTLCVYLIFTGVILDISGVRSGISMRLVDIKDVDQRSFSDRKLTIKGGYSTETLLVLVRIRIKSTVQRSKELQLAVGSLFCR